MRWSSQELDEFLLARAMEHDSPTLLFRLACEHLISARVIRPGVVKVLERVATAREAASGETFDRVVHLLTAQRQGRVWTSCSWSTTRLVRPGWRG